ncbi:MAG: tyrosine--tRNA ligase [Cyanobacteria bacterium NC_groundwater_1444_Ag_S-0.65um_54_12]|nr:tyrosine--tRNA ligase [Cyanobacteria bacterium NC_groundwater_1444_Ag_S-0.65um_54_12]
MVPYLQKTTSAAALLLGAQEAFPSAELARLLASNKTLRIKLGFDPTKPDLHLGHAVVLNGLRRFQEAGHQVVIIIGDFTARIGDPTGKETARPPLSAAEIAANASTYLDQLGLLIDLDKAEIHSNSEWLGKLSLNEIIQLMAKTTIAQLLARESFARRYERGDSIGLHEFLYPLLQGYDSVAINADIELGGTDQRFNLLVGRDLQQGYGQKPQICITYPILEGIDGHEKMSKSLDNYVGLTMPPAEMYGRTMSIPDSLLPTWYSLASGLPQITVQKILANLENGKLHPRDVKMQLAYSIVLLYHGAEAARSAQDNFIHQFQKKELPEEIPEYQLSDASLNICSLLVKVGLVTSTSEARRLVEQGGVKLHLAAGMRLIEDPHFSVEINSTANVIQVGKRRFVRIVAASE